jgi:hypothetical protein
MIGTLSKVIKMDRQFYEYVKQIVIDILKSNGMFIGQWHVGTVDQVISPTRLKVFVDGSNTSQTIPCNPDVTFNVGDYVWVVYINGNPRDKFVLCKRAVE